MVKRLIIISIAIFMAINIYPDNSGDKIRKKSPAITDLDYEPPKEKLKSPLVLFDVGGALLFKSRILLKSDGTDTYVKTTPTGFNFIPLDKWFFNTEGKVFGRMTFSGENYLHLSATGIFNFENQSIVPLFNVDELYLRWKYPIGKIIIGRTNYNLKAETIFSGPLDAIELTINVPFLNFKTFVGFSGFLGLFNPYFNPYLVSSYDGSFTEQTNLIQSKIGVQINDKQSRRIFFSTDFDVYLFSQHINPYFLMQVDISSAFGNTGRLINTFHLGANFEGKIVNNLFYTINFCGLFGTNQNPSTSETKAITSFALQSNLRYSINAVVASTFILGYSIGLGADDNSDFYSDLLGFSKETINKFYYYGKFDGGFALNPILSNIQSLSVKYVMTPKMKSKLVALSFYTSFYQTFKVYSGGSISDADAGSGTVVGSEFDIGLIVNAGKNASFEFDYGIFIPEEAYVVKTPKMRAGATFAITF